MAPETARTRPLSTCLARLLFLPLLLALALPAPAALLNFASIPLFVTTPVLPNVLVILDNSESMDGNMSGKLLTGDDPSTRGNIGRAVMRATITAFRTTFNWGLMTYQVSGASLQNTYAYFLGCVPGGAAGYPATSSVPLAGTGSSPAIGSAGNLKGCTPNGVNGVSGMYFTDNCDPVALVTPQGQRCVANPAATFTGGTYVTYDKTGDDPDVNDVLYIGNGTLGGCPAVVLNGLTYCASIWGLSPSQTAAGNTAYALYTPHSNTGTCGSGTDAQQWATGCFGCLFGCAALTFTPTDAGYLPSNVGTPTRLTPNPTPIWRQLYVPRGWGYLGTVSGAGQVVETVQADSTAHYNNLMAYLASETNTATSEIKNGAVYTPLPGTITSARNYFTGSTSPIGYACQRNFVMLVTDGLATANASGGLYSTAARSCAGAATTDTVTAISALRSTPKNSVNYDIQTYVVGLGNTVANPDAICAMNAMAAAGGTGTAFLATNQQAFTDAISSITADIIAKVGSGSAVSLNTGSLSTGANIYQAKFNTGDWSGSLLSIPLNLDGSLGTTAWDAGQVINSQASNSRVVLTMKTSTRTGIAFRWPANYHSPAATELDFAQADLLNLNASGVYDVPAIPAANSTGYGAQRVDYLRGSATNEAVAPYLFRPRLTSKLGDIVDSAPFYVGVPSYNYPDSMEAVPYSTFRNANIGRSSVVYVGANDGMLHGFDTGSGREVLAYVPRPLYPQLSKLTSQSYSHRYYVDGSPTIADAFFGGGWHSVLVGGLRAGGRGMFALDVTNPSAFSEANASHIVLWEFTDQDDPDLGFTFAQPAIIKTNLVPETWAAVFGNGYNNTDTTDGASATSATGHAVLYIVNLQTGALIRKIDTGVGTVATPNGLGTATPVDVNNNYTADYVYAGDLQGNVWKFDLTSSSAANWKVSLSTGPVATPTYLPIFTARDGSGNAQPITERLEVGHHPISGQLVYFGTGQYLATGDNLTTAQQSFYGIWDNGTEVGTVAGGGRSYLLRQTITSTVGVGGATYRTSSSNGNASTMYVAPLNYKGWYLDLPATGERQVTDPVLNNSRIIFTTTIPSTAACSYGGTGFLTELDPVTGNEPSTPIFDTNGDHVINSSDMRVSAVATSAIASSPGIIDVPPTAITGGGGSAGGSIQHKYTSQSDATIGNQLESGGGQNSKRVMWRQLK